MAGRFGRVETRRRAGKFRFGLLADLPRKNCWTLAEHAGDRDPHGMQHLLGRAVWDTDGVRDDLREFVTGQLGDADAVLVVDETGDLKKGTATVGVQRQYTGTAGRIENAQVAVYLTYAGARGHAMIDRELYLPRSWTEDPGRCAAVGVPAEIEFATKPALATGMLSRALAAGVPARWVAADEVYGADPGLRAELEYQQIGYVLAIGCDRRVPTAAGQLRADQPAQSGLVALTCNEIRRLLLTFLVEPTRTLACPLAWSRWRRRHHARQATTSVRRPLKDARNDLRLKY